MNANEGDAITYEKICFCDGSTYVGTLKGMQPDGLGTCTWKDGNQYDGEWKSGVMHGFGTYIWTSGQRYDGEWKDGRREGIGVKRYADGSTFDGFWKNGKKHGVGVFRPAQAPQHSYGKAGSLQQNMKRPDKEAPRGSLSMQRSSPHAEGSPPPHLQQQQQQQQRPVGQMVGLHIVEGAGHAVHIEQPLLLLQLLASLAETQPRAT
uniref:Uncharacterized protein n=1 Tax=Dunaliella tertiolecta TaxID=3047 RepID=A0A7S3R7P6_DUNTE